MRAAALLALPALLAAACAGTTSRSQSRRALDVYTDGEGHYLAVSFPMRQLYYGNESSFWVIRTYPATFRRIGFHDPRLFLPAVIAPSDDAITVTCLDKEVRLARVAEDAGNAILDDATFEPQQPTSTPIALGAAADGRYAYIDVDGDERRVFVGAPGAVHRVAVTASAGPPSKFHLDTAEGTFDVTVGDATRMSWNGQALAPLDPVAQWKLVFDELRVYPVRTPTPCDLTM